MPNFTLITGDGRGKTSTAMGHVFLQLQNGKSIVVVQFLKTGKNCGECEFFKNTNQVRWFCFGKEEFYISEQQFKEFEQITKEGIELLTEELNRTTTDVLLLDELGLALTNKLLKWSDLQPIFDCVNQEIIITGRDIPTEFRNEMQKIIDIVEEKHPYNEGIMARKGIDF